MEALLLKIPVQYILDQFPPLERSLLIFKFQISLQSMPSLLALDPPIKISISPPPGLLPSIYVGTDKGSPLIYLNQRREIYNLLSVFALNKLSSTWVLYVIRIELFVLRIGQ